MSNQAIRVVAAVITRENHHLICQRPAHKRHGGLWEFPGGKCEPGETDLAAITRELHEELGVAVVHVGPEIFAIDDPGSPFRIAFLPVSVDGDPVCHEHSAATWKRLGELPELPLAPSDRRFVEHCLRERSSYVAQESGGPVA